MCRQCSSQQITDEMRTEQQEFIQSARANLMPEGRWRSSAWAHWAGDRAGYATRLPQGGAAVSDLCVNVYLNVFAQDAIYDLCKNGSIYKYLH